MQIFTGAYTRFQLKQQNYMKMLEKKLRIFLMRLMQMSVFLQEVRQNQST